jgi:hypothetical protein
MAFLVVGHRPYGRVHGHGGEYAETVFVHVSFIPLFPLGSDWVSTEARPGEPSSFPIKLNGGSVLAAYLRTWMAAIAAFTLLVPSLAATAVAIALAGISAWSWTWRSRRGERALQRSDFDRIALGSRCDPAWMTRAMRGDLARKLDARLAARTDARPPDDVVEHGARDLEEATIAYGQLRIAGVQHASARRAAERLLASAFDAVRPTGSPYRDGHGGGGVPGLGAQISAAAQAHALAAEGRLRSSPARWYHDRWFQAFALVVLTAGAGSLLYARATTRQLDDRALRSLSPPVGDRAIVHCDRVDEGWDLLDGVEVKYRVKLCWIDKHVLPVVSKESDPVEGPIFEGELKGLEARGAQARDQRWFAQLHRDIELDARSYSVFLEGEGEVARRVELLVIGLSALGALIGWPLWIRAFLRRRRRPA